MGIAMEFEPQVLLREKQTFRSLGGTDQKSRVESGEKEVLNLFGPWVFDPTEHLSQSEMVVGIAMPARFLFFVHTLI